MAKLRKILLAVLLIIVGVLVIFFDYTRLEFAVAIGLVIFVDLLFEKEVTLTFGLYILLAATVLFIVSLGIAHMFGKNFIELANNSNTPYFFRLIPYLSITLGVLGSCLTVRFLITGNYGRR